MAQGRHLHRQLGRHSSSLYSDRAGMRKRLADTPLDHTASDLVTASSQITDNITACITDYFYSYTTEFIGLQIIN
jgi:hypothetical protein